MARARGIKQPHPLSQAAAEARQRQAAGVGVVVAFFRGVKQPHPLGSLPTRSGVSLLTAESGIAASALPGVKISALPAAGAANDSDQLEVNQGGTSRRITVDQVASLVMSEITPGTLIHVGPTPPPDPALNALWVDTS